MTGNQMQPASSKPLAIQADFHSEALLVLLMYCFGYWPGLIMNLYFLDKANAYYRASGYQAGGVGCLRAMLWVFVGLILLAIFAILVAILVPVLLKIIRDAR